MISEQLKNIKKQRKSIFNKLKVDFSFGNTEDMDDETILDLIPIETIYTGESSIHFDRFKLNEEEEIKFNREFSVYVKDLVQHVYKPDIEYLFDYMCRKYYAHKFNAKEIIFALIPNKKLFDQLRRISRETEFNYFVTLRNYSTEFIADLCVRNSCFFDFFIDYYDYYEHLSIFVDDITDKIINRVDFNVNKNLSQLYEIINKLYNSEYKSSIDARKRAYLIYRKVEKYIKADKKDFLAIFGDNVFCEELGDETKTSNINVKYNKNIFEEFENFSKYHKGRRYLKDDKLLREYLKYLYVNDITDHSFTKYELELLFKVFLNNFGGHSAGKNLVKNYEEANASEYLELVKDLNDKRLILEYIVRFHEKEINLFLNDLKGRDLIFIVERIPSISKEVINEENYKEIMEIVKDEGMELFKICFSYKNFEAKYFKLKDPASIIIKILDESKEYINIVKLVEYHQKTLEDDNFNEIINHMINIESYKNPIFLDYLSKLDLKYNFYGYVINNLKDYNSITIIKLFMNSDDIEHINEIVKYFTITKDYLEIFFIFTYKHRKIINEELLLLVFKENDYNKKIYDTLKFYLVENKCTSNDFEGNKKIKNIIEEVYKRNKETLGILLVDFSYETILRFLDIKDRIRYLVKYKNSSLEYLKYISNFIRDDRNIVNILLQNIEKLVYLFKVKEWDGIKIILIEGLNDKNNQIVFDSVLYILLTESLEDKILNDYIDILEEICNYETVINDYDVILNICKKLSKEQKATLIDLFTRKINYEDIRIVPVVAKDLIAEKKVSVSFFIEKYKNVMSLYISDILVHYSKIYPSLLDLNTVNLIKGIIFSYEYLKKDISNNYEDLNNILLLLDSVLIQKKDIKDYSKLLSFIYKYKEEVNESNVYLTLKSYYKYNKNLQVDCTKILDYLYTSKIEVFLNISYKLCRYNVNTFDLYVKDIIENLDPFSLTKFRLLHHYFKYKDTLESIDVSTLFAKFLEFYFTSKDLEIAKTISFLLNHDVSNILKYNSKILKHLKNPSILDTLKLLQVLYSNTNKYNICIYKSTSHLALLIDCSDKDIKKETRTLINIIEDKYNINPFVSED